MCQAFAYLIKTNRSISIIIPLVLLYCALQMPTSGLTLKSSINNNIPYQTAKMISQDIVDQVIQADVKHKNKTEISIPQFSSSDNWPLSHKEQRISEVLFKYHLISKRITITFNVDSKANKKYGIKVPKN